MHKILHFTTILFAIFSIANASNNLFDIRKYQCSLSEYLCKIKLTVETNDLFIANSNTYKCFNFTKIETCKDEQLIYLNQNECNTTDDEHNYVYLVIQPICLRSETVKIINQNTNVSFQILVQVIRPDSLSADYIYNFMYYAKMIIAGLLAFFCDIKEVSKKEMIKPALIGFFTPIIFMPLVFDNKSIMLKIKFKEFTI